MRMLGLGLSALLFAGCALTRGSAVVTGGTHERFNGAVRIVSLAVPAGAKECGLVQARGVPDLARLVAEFREQTARIGGNLGVIEKISTKFEMQTQAQSYTYACGNSQCTGTRSVQVEVATTQLLGRAYRLEGP